MPDTTSAPAAVAAAVIVDELIRAGVREAVLCPGSRSAPLARELLRAEAAGRLRLHVRLDERSAAFLALGLAAGTGRVTPVLTTSGTAVANLAPAMVEATFSAIPLLALTADRPAGHRGTGANQTIVQDRLFADASAVHRDVDATGGLDAAGQARLRALVDRVAAAMRAPGLGGAGHLNVRLAEPLVPAADLPAALAPGRPGGATWTEVRHLQPPARPAATATVDLSRRTLVIAGAGARPTPALAGVPTIAEPGAPAPDVPVHPLAAGLLGAGPLLGAAGVADPRPEQLIVLGRPTLHRPVAALLADPGIDVTVVTGGGLPGPADYPDVAANARRTTAAVEVRGAPDRRWLRTCAAASDIAAEAVRDTLAAGAGAPGGLHVAAAVTDSLRTGDLLVLGSSSPVRDCSLTGLPFPGVDVHAGRGAAGIDGTVATAVGLALARDRAHPHETRPPRTLALMGDLTFLHDAAGLNIPAGEPRPGNLTIVVANDSGGAIFETLEAGAPGLRAGFERIFATPQDVDIAALCAAYGVAHRRLDDLGELVAELHPDTDVDGIRVLEFRADRAGRRDLHAELARRTGAGATAADGAGE